MALRTTSPTPRTTWSCATSTKRKIFRSLASPREQDERLVAGDSRKGDEAHEGSRNERRDPPEHRRSRAPLARDGALRSGTSPGRWRRPRHERTGPNAQRALPADREREA